MDTINNRSAFDDEEDDDDDGEYEDSWISWFCGHEGNEFVAEVDEDYIRDRFNLFGLKPQIPSFEKSIMIILNGEPSAEDASDSEAAESFHGARDLYGLVHSRFIISPRGLAIMKEKFMRGAFNQCPRVLCDRQNCLPVGLTDKLEEYKVRVYCPKCQEAYEVAGRSANLADGAYFGTSFPHIFLQTYPNLVPLDVPVPYQPKVFGFKVHGRKSIIQRKLNMGEYGDSLIPESVSPHQRQLPSSTTPADYCNPLDRASNPQRIQNDPQNHEKGAEGRSDFVDSIPRLVGDCRMIPQRSAVPPNNTTVVNAASNNSYDITGTPYKSVQQQTSHYRTDEDVSHVTSCRQVGVNYDVQHYMTLGLRPDVG